MERIANIVIVLIFIVFSFFTVSFGWTAGTTNKFMDKLEHANAEVLAMEAGLLVVDFDTPIINTCGDTNIYGYITTQDGITLQLKPLYIPEIKEEAFINNDDGNILIFPVYDILPFILDPGIYGVEIFIDNNCSLFSVGSVEIKPFTFIVERERGVSV